MKFSEFSLAWSILLVAGCAGAVSASGSPVFELRDAVTVTGATIRLSDLLPQGASLEVRRASVAVDLGRVPQPGSVRVLAAAKIASRLQGQPLLLHQLILPTRVTVRSFAWPLDRRAVHEATVKFLRDHGWKDKDLPDAAGLELPSVIATVQPDPALEVTATEWDIWQEILQIHLRCSDATRCGNFLVRSRTPRPPDAKGQAQATAEQKHRAWNLPARRRRLPALARAGERATLLLDTPGIHMALQVVCLERGSLGQRVRVRDSGSQRLFQAEVVAAGLLRAVF